MTIREVLRIKIRESLDHVEEEINKYSSIETEGNKFLEEVYYEYVYSLNELKSKLDSTIELLEETRNESV